MTRVPALAWSLGASIAINIALGVAYLNERDASATAKSRAVACSDATAALKKLADKHKREATTARVAAARSASTHNKRADAMLARQPKDPDDSCASIQAMGDDWLKGRGK